jgi:hypothetical protein
MVSRKGIAALLSVVAIAAAAFAAAPAQAALKHFDGTVVSKDANAKTFRIATQSGTLRIKVNSGTEFERIAGGFSGLSKGLAIEVDARQTSNGLVAVQVEPQGGNGGGGGGSDDSGGDDHGGHGGGSDDGPNHA